MDDNNLNFLILSILDGSHRKFVKNNHIDDYYKGTFTSDRLNENNSLRLCLRPGGKSFLISFVVNTLDGRYSDSSSIGHWLAVIIQYSTTNKTLTLRFVDSFGKKYTSYHLVAKFINGIKLKCLQNHVKFVYDSLTYPFQSRDSKVCGGYVCYAITHIWEKKNDLSLKKIFSNFKTKGGERGNDMKIIHFIESHWNTGFCHNDRINNNTKVLPIKKLLQGSTFPPPFCPKKTLGTEQCNVGECKCIS